MENNVTFTAEQNFWDSLKNIDVQFEIFEIQRLITRLDIEIISSFGKKVTRHKNLYEKYWHLTEDYSKFCRYRNCDFYHSHTEKNNILTSGVSENILKIIFEIHKKIENKVNQISFSMYPAYVATYLTPTRNRLPIHTHNTHKHIEKDDDSLISLSFAIRLTNNLGIKDQTKIQFYRPHQHKILRLEEELNSHVDDFKYEFKPGHFSVYGFNTENSPHTALCGEDLYCWLVFDYVEFKFPFEYEKFKYSNNILAFDYF